MSASQVRFGLFLLAAPLLWGASPKATEATTGGPDVSSLLGYETRTGKIYFEVTSYSEGPGTVIYSIAADSIGRTAPVPWPRPQLPPNDFKAHELWTQHTIDSLRTALVHPDTLPRARAQFTSNTLRVWNFAASDDYTRRPEYSVDVKLSILALSGHATITTFCVPNVRSGEIFLIPGGKQAIARVIYTGVPYESCYDTDTFVLLTLGQSSISR